ncbi:hypothetical protein [Thalassotalea litorea]|uniref:hypothetical protein n=1 Tax=Thalassotalea litorea TaxID=2020715 RepID=UPI003735B5FF
MKLLHSFLLIILGCLASCTDMYDPLLWKSGSFTLEFVDSPENASLRSDSTLEHVIPASVFEVGANETYIVAKQRPRRNRSIINYFYINTREFPKTGRFNPSHYVVGPLTETEFTKKSEELQLPAFSYSIAQVKGNG